MAEQPHTTNGNSQIFSFFKGQSNVIEAKADGSFEWKEAAQLVRGQLNDAMNVTNLAFLLGSGCSSLFRGGSQVGVPTMEPMAREFTGRVGEGGNSRFLTTAERQSLIDCLGLDITTAEFASNLEGLMEVLHSFEYALERSHKPSLNESLDTVRVAIEKVAGYVLSCCTDGDFSRGNDDVVSLYESFYRKLIYRDRSLPRPWVFTTNYDLFNEIALDRIGINYSNGFSGTVERRFNPATFRYSLAEQLDISDRKWTAIENFVHLCKLHGSVNWVEDPRSIFRVRELQNVPHRHDGRVLIYPTPLKQRASFSAPYSDLLREFQMRTSREQSLLISIGYSFGDEHINNIIFQALTIPTFRLVTFSPPDTDGPVSRLRSLDDPRIWIIGGDGFNPGEKAHYFETIVQWFMPQPPSNRVDTAVGSVVRELLSRSGNGGGAGSNEL